MPTELDLGEPTRRRLHSLHGLIADFDREIELGKREIDALARNDAAEVLCQLRGVGPYARGGPECHAGTDPLRVRRAMPFLPAARVD